MFCMCLRAAKANSVGSREDYSSRENVIAMRSFFTDWLSLSVISKRNLLLTDCEKWNFGFWDLVKKWRTLLCLRSVCWWDSQPWHCWGIYSRLLQWARTTGFCWQWMTEWSDCTVDFGERAMSPWQHQGIALVKVGYGPAFRVSDKRGNNNN